MSTAIVNLKKVGLLLQATVCLEGIRGMSAQPFFFIYGVAGGGLCPFEMEVRDRVVGDTFEMNLSPAEMQPFFGHLYQPFLRHLNLPVVPQKLSFTATVASVEEPDERDIIKAMAAAVGGGCHKGCGCGSH